MARNGKNKSQLVTVDKVAELFGISERAVQRLVIYDGMPRVSRGEYDWVECSQWYVAHLHEQVCGCAGPCDGFDTDSRNATNARAERKAALKEIATGLAPELVGLREKEIERVLAAAVDEVYKAS
jgi:hypothetical protein